MALTLEGLEKWYMQTVKMKYAFAGETPPEPIPLPDVTTIDGLLEGIVAESEDAFVAAAKNTGNYHDYDVAYTLQLPAKIYRWYGLKKVGGRTIIWNQSLQEGYLSAQGGTASLDSETGEISYTFTSVGTNKLNLKRPTVTRYENDHKYIVTFDTYSGKELNLYFYRINVGGGNVNVAMSAATGTDQWSHRTAIYTGANNGRELNYGQISFYHPADSGFQVGDVVKFRNLQWWDLTEIYGAGNEPSTVAEFEALFPAYYAYSVPTLMNAGVTNVVSKDSNNAEIDNLAIPAEVQALAGYGLSAGSAYNYIDFENKKFIQNVGSVDLGSLSWEIVYSSNSVPRLVGSGSAINNIKTVGLTVVANIISSAFTPASYGDIFSGNADNNSIGVYNGGTNIVIRATDYEDAEAFKTAMNGVYANYELATPVETDISAYLTDNDIEVEAGGTLTFKNQNGDDYGIPVPSRVDYIGK